MTARRHEWIAMVVYRLDDEQAARFHAGPPGPIRQFTGAPPIDPSRVTLTADMVDQERSQVGCWRCEQPWHRARHTACRGEPVAYSNTGEPIYADGDSDG